MRTHFGQTLLPTSLRLIILSHKMSLSTLLTMALPTQCPHEEQGHIQCKPIGYSEFRSFPSSVLTHPANLQWKLLTQKVTGNSFCFFS